MKIDEIKIPNKQISRNNKQDNPVKTKPKSHNQIDDKMWRDAGYAMTSEGIASILMQGCPDFIAQEIERDFYEDRCNGLVPASKKRSVAYKTISERFSGEERYELLRQMEKFEDVPSLVSSIVLAKNEKDNTYRFDGFECAEIVELVDSIKNNKEWFNDVIGLKKEDNSPMFSAPELCLLIELSDQMHVSNEAAMHVINLKDKKGKQIFDTNEVLRVLNDAKVNGLVVKRMRELAPEIDIEKDKISAESIIAEAKLLAEKTYTNEEEEVMTKEEKLDAELLPYGIYELILKYANSSNKIISCSEGTSYNAEELRRNIMYSKTAFKTIMDAAEELSPSRFSDEEKLLVSEKINYIRKNGTDRFVNYMDIKNADDSFAFNARDCLSYMQRDIDKTLLQSIFKMVDPKTGEQRFTKEDNIFCLNGKKVRDIELFKQNAFLRDEKTNEYRFDLEDCLYLDSISATIKKYPDFYNYLLSIKEDGEFRFSSEEIGILIRNARIYGIYPEIFDKMINMKHGDDYRFTPIEINELMGYSPIIKTNMEFFDKIASAEQAGEPRFSGASCAELLKNILDIRCQQELFDRLFEAKSGSLYKFGAHSCLRLLDAEDEILEYPLVFEKLVKCRNINEYNVISLLNYGDIKKIEKHIQLFDEIFNEKNPFYKKFGYDGKRKIFSFAEKIDKDREIWDETMKKFQDRKYAVLDKCMREFLNNYYFKHPTENPYYRG